MGNDVTFSAVGQGTRFALTLGHTNLSTVITHITTFSRREVVKELRARGKLTAHVSIHALCFLALLQWVQTG
ncbi:hypothetical protein KSF_011860 [Reticulibacter mediterranei]|uniref:Uncharacterized protein n=1 Tax=Reticulibacter mediterranei TaxID=2778369 RepID=A0A8J3IEP1_9CHLR|nr:hypothetical protein [Reticulibacter mediterranei]GHO91138.1 hypothetical protein KSF_011860 [Reticulibacter mediterranei]